MARLFGKEYHEISNSWLFKGLSIPFNKGDLLYQAAKNEKGYFVIRFFSAKPNRIKFPSDIVITYDPQKNKIINSSCHCCHKDNHQCLHYISVIEYAYNYLSSDFEQDADLCFFQNSLLAYNSWWQSTVMNAKIQIEGLYTKESNKIRFFFTGYDGINFKYLCNFITNKILAPEEKEMISTLSEQAAAFSAPERDLLSKLMSIKCSFSSKNQYFSIYKKDFPQTIPFLRNLSYKIAIKETGEPFIFNDQEYPLFFHVSKVDKNKYLVQCSAKNMVSAYFTGNSTYLFEKNIVNELKLPFKREVIEKFLESELYCTHNDLIHLKTAVAKQSGMSGCHFDFDEDIEFPEYYSDYHQVVLQLSTITAENEENSIKLSGFISYADDISLPIGLVLYNEELIGIKKNKNEYQWFYLPFDIRREITNFFALLPIPDSDNMMKESYYIFSDEKKKDYLKKVIYEDTNSKWTINIDDKLKSEFVFKVELKPEITVNRFEDGIDWFDYKVEYKFFNETFSHNELKKFFKTNDKYLKLKDNRLVYFPDKNTFEQIDYFVEQGKKQKNSSLNQYNLSYLYILSQGNNDIKLYGDIQIKKICDDLLKRQLPQQQEIPIALSRVLRSYQKYGYHWLNMLQQHSLGGILADDMGLGKTLQTLTILSAYYQNNPSDLKLSLVICPKTLLFNWAAEIEKFHPNLSYLIYEGKKEDRLQFWQEKNKRRVDVIIVSYSLIQQDIIDFMQDKYAYIIIDEAQHIKNPNTMRTKAVKKLNGEHRLALTGTPMENSPLELWSIYDFLMPGYLFSLNSFKKRFYTNGEYVEDANLSKVISPFILRRKKSDVLTELPDKQEQTLFCKMTPQQENLYLKIINTVKTTYFSDTPGLDNKNYINILAALTRMRQVCNHPALIEKEMSGKKDVSGKLDLVMELTRDAIENNRKILLFSQFSSMLKLIATELDKSSLSYLYMDGTTQNRKEIIDDFCSNEKVRLFLLTLKVGGLGLNLTAADTVIIVDPWWNPMAENQAIDRVYRIGQTKKVMVYKIITKGSVEEKIQLLQDKKNKMFSNIVEESQTIIKKMSVKDLKSLFEYVT